MPKPTTAAALRKAAIAAAVKSAEEKPYLEEPGRLVREVQEDAAMAKNLADEKVGRADWRDSDYYAVLVFQSSAQRDAALKAAGLEPDRFIDGHAFIAALQLDVPAEEHAQHRMSANKPWLELT
jgi:hypothetical protein